MSEGIKTTVGIQGDKEYKAALADINRTLNVLNTGMKASQAAFGSQATAMAGMQDKLKGLNSVYDAQRQKVDLIAAQLDKAKAKYGENSSQAQQLQIALNRATAQMNATRNEITSTESGLRILAEAQQAAGGETDAANMTLKEAEDILRNVADESKDLGNATQKAGKAAKDEGQAAESASKGNDRLREAMEKAGSVAKGALVAGLKAAATAAGAVATATGGAIVKSFQFAQDAGEYADNILTMSQQTGVAAKSLQEWQYAANFIDVSVDDMAGAMSRLTRTAGDAASGNKAAQKQFSDLGIVIQDSSGHMRDSESIFWDVIDALGNIPDETKRDAVAMDLLGESAQQLNPLIEAGSRAWRDMGKEAEAMGVVFSDENLEKMGAFDDSMQRFKATGTALKNSIGLVMIPAFQGLVDTATDSMSKIAIALQNGATPEEMDALFNDLLTTAGGALNQVAGMAQKAAPLIAQALTRAIAALGKNLPGMLDALLPAAMGILQTLADAVTENIGPITDLATQVLSSLADFLIENLPTLTAAAVQLLDGLLDALLEALPELITAGIDMAAQLAAGLVQAIPDLIAKLPEIVSAIWDGLTGVDWGTLGGDVLTAITGGLGELGDSLSDLFTGAIGAVSGLDFASIGTTIKTAVTGILGDGGFVSKAFEDAKTNVEGIDWAGLGDNVAKAGSALVNMTGEALAGGFTAGYALISAIDWGALGTTVGGIANGLVSLTGDAAAAGFKAAHAAIAAIDWEGLGNTVGGIANGLVDLTGDAAAAGFTAAHSLIDAIDWPGLGTKVGNVANALIDVGGEALAAPFKTAASVIQGIEWGTIGDSIANGLNRAWGIVSGLGDVALGFGEGVVAASQSTVSAFKDWATNLWKDDQASDANLAGQKIITDAAAGVTAAQPTLAASAQDAAKALLTALQGVLTAEALQAVGQGAGDNVTTGLYLSVTDAETAGKALAQAVVDAAAGILSATAGSSLGQTFGGGVKTGASASLRAAVTAARAAAANAVSSADFPGIGRNMAKGIAQGLDAGLDTVRTAARRVAAAAHSAAQVALDEHSPSRKGMYLGRMYVQGIVEGEEDAENDLVRASRGLAALMEDNTVPDANGRTWGLGAANPATVDYDQMRQAFIDAIRQTGVGHGVMMLDKHTVGGTLEPYSSQAARQRATRTAAGRAAAVKIR